MTPSLISAMTTDDAVAVVLDADRLSELLGRPVRADRLRIKPEVSVLVSLTDRSTGLTAGWARLLWPVSHSKAAQAERLAARLGLAPSPVTRPLDEGLLLQRGEVLTDPKLAEPLAQATDLGVLGTWAARDVLRYNPSRRLVLTDGSTVLRLRTGAGGPADDVHRTLSGLLPVPGLLDSQAVSSCEGRVSVQQWCGDTNLADFYADNADGVASAQGPVEATRRVGTLLAELHSCTGQLPADLVDLLPHQPPCPRELAEVHARQLDVMAPELARRARAVGGVLPDRLPGAVVLTHGDASPDQVLYEYSTGRIWLTDFDRACLAPAATDLGSYLAEAPSCQRHALLEGYAVHRLVPSDEELGWAIALSRLARLADPLRRAHPSWRERISADLAAIERIARSPEKEASWA